VLSYSRASPGLWDLPLTFAEPDIPTSRKNAGFSEKRRDARASRRAGAGVEPSR